MSKSHGERFQEIVYGKATSMLLGADKKRVRTDVCGPGYVIGPTPGGQPGLQVGWSVMISIEHDRLLGQPPIAASIPLTGVLPPDTLFEQAAAFLVSEVLKLRDKANNPLTDAPNPEAAAAEAVSGLPAGLRKMPPLQLPAA